MEKLYVGIDLHSNNNVISIIDGENKQIYCGKLKNSLNEVLEKLAPYKEGISGIVVESTFNWYWLVDGLMENGYKLHLSNPGANEQYSGKKNINDKNDARWLADFLRLNILKEGYVMDAKLRAIRDLCRKRMQLVRMRTSNILSIRNLFSRNLGAITAKEIAKTEPDQLIELFGDKNLVRAVSAAEIKDVEKIILDQISLAREFQKLKTIKGVGDILAQTIMLEVGNIGRFKKVGNFASYSRCVSADKISNGKKKGRGNRKNGNKYLSWAFTEAAISLIHWNPDAKKFYERKKKKTMPVVAIKALAHKIARASYYIMKDQVEFDSAKLFGH